MWKQSCLAALVLASSVGWAQRVTVPNPSFEEGTGSPAGWALSGGNGEWLDGKAADGRRAVAVTGDGQNSNDWRSGPIAFQPGAVYRLTFSGRGLGSSGGTPISGPVFCNRDLWRLPEEWKEETSIFFTPRQVTPENGWLRFGQWCVNGTVAFDRIALVRAYPVYATAGDLVLGEGEAVSGNSYVFEAPFNSESRNHSRPLESDQCTFNSNRWVFGSGSDVVYRHQVGNRKQTAVTVEPSIGWYASGELVVEASLDGKSWRELGIMDGLGAKPLALPAEMLPAAQVWIRLRAQAKQRVGQDSDPGSLQIHGYTYRAALDGAPAEAQGKTRFVSVVDADPRLDVAVLDLGTGLPGATNAVRLAVTNRAAAAVAIKPDVRLEQAGEPVSRHPDRAASTLPAGVSTSVLVPYEVPGTGEFGLVLTLGDGIKSRFETSLSVPALYSVGYGEQLPGSTPQLGLWWADSGWKIARPRPLPSAKGEAVLIRAAANEAEAAQFVVRPATPLAGVTVAAGPLTGPGGAVIPAERIDLLRVRYVNITRPTDETGAVAPWPDPLPPLTGAIDLAANENQPFWVRVRVPARTPAGVYGGTLYLKGRGLDLSVPLQVEVFGFELPARMTCSTAFGFSLGNVLRYQNVKDPDQVRAVLAKYWENYSAHHISPYDPAPLDPFRTVWPTAGGWTGGTRDQNEKHAGQSSLRLQDDSPNGSVSARYPDLIPIPPAGFRFRFWYRTRDPGQSLIVTLNHHDAGGQWLSGRNHDMPVEGNGEWQAFDRTITRFPEGAKSVGVTLWATVWREDGSPTGTVWYDDVSLQDAGTGTDLLKGGDFEPLAPASLAPAFQWDAWDAAMERAMSTYQFTSFSVPVPGLGGGTFHSRVEPSLLGYGENTPEYLAAFRGYVQGVQEHLQARGWLDRAFVYWFDEPDPKDYAFVMNGFRKLKENAPGLRRMLTEQVEPELVGGPNLWCPVSPEYNHERAEPRRAQGEQFWWYVCCGPKAPYCTLFIDHPATELRVWLWQTWQRRIEGILVWESTYWSSPCAYPDANQPQDPYVDPMSWISGYDTKPGTKTPWGNGDGRFVYPPEAAASAAPGSAVLGGPVDSIRWEMLRDGIEDYEYLAMLKRVLVERGDRLAAAERQGLAKLLEVPAAITTDMTTFTKSPEPIAARRLEVARALEQLTRP